MKDELSGIFLITMICLSLFLAGGWFLNAAKLFTCDFKAPYKCEIVRSVGVICPPVGAIAGYMDLGR